MRRTTRLPRPFSTLRPAAFALAGALLVPAPLGVVRASDAPVTPAATRQAFEEEVGQFSTEKARLDRAVIIAFIRENVTPDERRLAREFIEDFDARLIVDRTEGYFDQVSHDRQVEMLEIFDKCFPDMRGYDFRLNNLIARAIGSPDREVRRKASAIAARFKVREAYFPLRRRANRSSGEDRLEAIRTIGEMADARGAYFLPDLLRAREPGVVEATLQSLGKLGRVASITLKEQIVSGSPATSRLALQELMSMPAIDDLPAYYAYVQSHPELKDPLKTDLYNLIARLEVARDKGLEAPRD